MCVNAHHVGSLAVTNCQFLPSNFGLGFGAYVCMYILLEAGSFVHFELQSSEKFFFEIIDKKIIVFCVSLIWRSG